MTGEEKPPIEIPDFLKKALDEGPDPGTHEWIRHQQKEAAKETSSPMSPPAKSPADPKVESLSQSELRSRINKLLGGEKKRTEIRARTEKENNLRVRAIRARGY